MWLVEGVDVVERRRGILVGVVAGVVLIGLVLAALLPDVVPPAPQVGAAVGVAALLLGLAAAIAVDATDLTIRGPRHVRAAGGSLLAVLPREVTPGAASPVADVVLASLVDADDPEPGGPAAAGQEMVPVEGPALVGVAAAGRDPRAASLLADALSVALACEGVSVLCADVASASTAGAGVAEVVCDGVRLTDTVTFEPGLRLARVGPGRDHAIAVESVQGLRSRLPRDLDVLVVALPTAASRQVVQAAGALHRVIVVAERDQTSRVDLIAAVDAMASVGTYAEVVLLDDVTAAHLAPSQPDAAEPDAADPDDAGPATAAESPAEAARDREVRLEEVDAPAVVTGPSTPRELDVLEGAATAAALAQVADTPVESEATTGPSGAAPAASDDEPDGDGPAAAADPPSAATGDEPDGGPVAADVEDDLADDPTDELAPLPAPTSAAAEPRDRRRVDPGPMTDADLLRETAQLSILLDDLGSRGSARPPAPAGSTGHDAASRDPADHDDADHDADHDDAAGPRHAAALARPRAGHPADPRDDGSGPRP